MESKIIGVTTEYEKIPEILGVKSESEYGLYLHTDIGDYYGRILPNGTFDNEFVRLISSDQSKEFEDAIIQIIEKAKNDIIKTFTALSIANLNNR